MAFSLGTIFTKLDAETSSFLKGFAGASKTVERFAKQVKQAASQVAQVGTALTAMGAGALALAATVDGQTKKALDGMKAATTGLAVEVSRTLLPAVQSMTESIRALADWFAGLSPGTKQLISDFAIFAAQAALVGMALSKVAGLVSGVSGAVAALVKAIAGVGVGPLMGIALGIGAVIAAVLVLHKAWRENWGGIQQHAKAVLQWLQDTWADVFGKLGKWADALALKVLDAFDSIATAAQRMFEGLGWDSLASAAKAAKEMFRTLREDVQSKGLGGVVKSIIEDMAETGKAGGLALKNEFQLIMKELGIEDLFKSAGRSHSGRAAKTITGFAEKGGIQKMPGVLSASEGSVLALAATSKRHTPGQRLGQTSTAVAGEGAMEAAKTWWEGIENASSPALAQFAGRLKLFWDEAVAQLGAAVMGGVNKLSSMLGDVGDLMQAGIQGFQSGGIWGALIALILELLSKFERWGEVLDMAQAAFQKLLADLGPGLNAIIDAFKGLISALQPLANLIHGILNPVLLILAQALRGIGALISLITAVLAPVLSLIGGIFAWVAKVIEPVTAAFETVVQALTPIIEILGSLLGVLTPLEPVFRLIGWVISFVALSILGTINVIGLIINAIANSMVIDTPKIQAQMAQIWKDMGNFEGKSLDPVGTGAVKAAEGLEKLNQAFMETLSNVPSWYKVAQARYDAADGGGWGVASMGGSRGQTIIISGPVTIAASDPAKFGEALQREAYRQTGNRYAGLVGVP